VSLYDLAQEIGWTNALLYLAALTAVLLLGFFLLARRRS
jgi:hypothetical protein